MEYHSLCVRFEGPVCYIQLYRPESNNTIDAEMVRELKAVLQQCEESQTVVILEGLPEVFCFGADFGQIHDKVKENQELENDPKALYELWLQLATGSFVSIAHVRGKANAGGVGFVAACDIVLADETAVFSLSELLFGLYPACVLPFLMKKIGSQKARYMTLMTKPIDVKTAYEWGLVDAYEKNSKLLLRRHLARLCRLQKSAIKKYKEYMNRLDTRLQEQMQPAVLENKKLFKDPQIQEWIFQYQEFGKFPWDI